MTIKELCKKHTNCTVCPYLPICGDRPENYSLGNDLEVTNAIIETAKALEQEPCEDCISRVDALKALDYDIKSFEFKSGVGRHMNEIASLLNTIYEIQSDNIKALPPVQPKPKIGHWKFVQRGKYIDICCPNCGYQRVKEYAYNYTVDQISDQDIKDFFSKSNMNFCEKCGARMIDPQAESEE